jgi:hypothetical protein|tara:strand:+ start:208 stop:438 length:231 start_codon:yes stop_codon:yes gene_type:complete
MTYVFEKETSMGTLVVEYVLSSVSNAVKVVEMTLGGKYHRHSWMGKQGQLELIDELERDLLDRACKTGIHEPMEQL